MGQKRKGAKQVFLRKLWDGSCLLGAAAEAVLVMGEGVLSGRRTGRARYDHSRAYERSFHLYNFYLLWTQGITKLNHAASQISWLE